MAQIVAYQFSREQSMGVSIVHLSQDCELDRFLIEFEFKKYLQVRVLRIFFSSSTKMTEFEFAALDFIGCNGMNK